MSGFHLLDNYLFTSLMNSIGLLFTRTLQVIGIYNSSNVQELFPPK